MTGDRELSVHYWAVVQDLERQRDIINGAIGTVTNLATFYSERAVRDYKPPEPPAPPPTEGPLPDDSKGTP